MPVRLKEYEPSEIMWKTHIFQFFFIWNLSVVTLDTWSGHGFLLCNGGVSFGCCNTEIMGFNYTRGMDVCAVLSHVGVGFMTGCPPPPNQRSPVQCRKLFQKCADNFLETSRLRVGYSACVTTFIKILQYTVIRDIRSVCHILVRKPHKWGKGVVWV
jgi:hypothetical protein